jgi:hypothetical protein
MNRTWQPAGLASASVCVTVSLWLPTCSPATDRRLPERVVAEHADLQAAHVRERLGGQSTNLVKL